MAITKNTSHISDSEQRVLNKSFDDDYNVLAVLPLNYDGTNLQRVTEGNMAMKITESGDYTYIGVAPPGTSQATTKWQCRRLDQSSGLVILWADGNADFDNAATDLTSLSYS